LPSDIAKFFATKEDADAAFALFDKDENGDATRDEVEMVCKGPFIVISAVVLLDFNHPFIARPRHACTSDIDQIPID
jgi:Ca2+-binding EF-hand superfamily protein